MNKAHIQVTSHIQVRHKPTNTLHNSFLLLPKGNTACTLSHLTTTTPSLAFVSCLGFSLLAPGSSQHPAGTTLWEFLSSLRHSYGSTEYKKRINKLGLGQIPKLSLSVICVFPKNKTNKLGLGQIDKYKNCPFQLFVSSLGGR